MGNSGSSENNSHENKGRNAICILQKQPNNLIYGIVKFHQCSLQHPVKIMFRLSGPANQVHAIHIHEYGDLTNGCESMGKHFNPDNTTHGSYFYRDNPRHAGDLINNLKFDQYGKFEYTYEDYSISLFDDRNIIGRSIVIHEGQDDLGRGQDKESLISGNAGKRVTCNIIGISETKHF